MRRTYFFLGIFLNLITFALLFFAWFPDPRNAVLMFLGVILFPISLLFLLLGNTSESQPLARVND